MDFIPMDVVVPPVHVENKTGEDIKASGYQFKNLSELYDYLNKIDYNYWIDLKDAKYIVLYKDIEWDVINYTCSSYHPHVTLISKNALGSTPMTLLGAMNYADTYDENKEDFEVVGSIPYLNELLEFYGIDNMPKVYNKDNRACFYWTLTTDHNRKEIEPIIDKENERTIYNKDVIYYVIGRSRGNKTNMSLLNMDNVTNVAIMLYITDIR